MNSDILVIGGGIHGCATALRLAQAGAEVTVLERSVPGAEASTAAGGILSPGVEAQHGGPLLALAQESMRRWPSFVEELRDASGLDERCAAFVMRQPLATSLVDHAERLLTEVLPAVEAEGRASLTVAFGCTGGRHRSVALAEALGGRLVARGLTPLLLHRDVAR